MHVLLAKNTPEQMIALFDSNKKVKLAFAQCLTDSVPRPESKFTDRVKGYNSRAIHESGGSADEPGGYDDQSGGYDSDEMDEEHFWDERLHGYLKHALQQCQAKLQAYFLESRVVHKEDIDLHIVCKCCTEDTGLAASYDAHHVFLALRSRTQQLDCDVYTIDTRPIAPHARWIFARVLAALCGRQWGVAALTARLPEPWERRGRSLAVQTRDPPAAGPRWKVVVTEDQW